MRTTKTHIQVEGLQEVYLVDLENPGGIQVSISTFGATITRILVPQSDGTVANVVLGYERLEHYLNDDYYVGSLVGRFAGRIANGEFLLEDRKISLAKTPEARHHLHGGIKGFNKKNFKLIELREEKECVSLQLYYRSSDGEEGFPGNLDLNVSYKLNKQNQLTITYKAVTDKATHLNLTNHSYFNLSGTSEPALDHTLCINADEYLLTDEEYIPTGDIVTVENTPYDFREPKPIGVSKAQLEEPGFNACYVLKKGGGNDDAATLLHRGSGRNVKIRTTFPGLLFYTGDYLDRHFQKCQGICLETQFFPDSPNHHTFPTTLLKPGEEFMQETSYEFGW